MRAQLLKRLIKPLLAFVIALLTACGGGGSGSSTAAGGTGQVQFVVGNSSAVSASPKALKSQSISNTPSVPSPIIYVPADQIKTVTSAQFVLKNASGISTTYNATILKLGSQYITTPISVPVGAFQLTSFLLYNGATVVYGTPVAGSGAAGLVSNPLPMTVGITKDTVTTTAPEVVDVVLGVAADFGATSFTFNVVAARAFKISTFAYNTTTQLMEYVNANIVVTDGTNNLYAGTLSAKTNDIFVLKQIGTYAVTINKTGYISQTFTFTDAQIAAYADTPLDVYLEKSRFQNLTQLNGATYDKSECVIDTQTGLIWEGKTESGQRDKTKIYTNYMDASLVNDTAAYVVIINNSALCGKTNWRIPSFFELSALTESLAALGQTEYWFPDYLINIEYWNDASAFGGSATLYRPLNLSSGHINRNPSYQARIRLVSD